ncbi:hypothetical protein BDD43_3143 [Mucilaginibacter gracilis]|uniref:Uncharacterized protein n=1 Tax=Mucilaginibacter gracilis TaxID=423350 RepID=A0A495J1V6_9SPHI|nr:hypothetical protein BDD43_3143 [Mucilaginibacter gracilis]
MYIIIEIIYYSKLFRWMIAFDQKKHFCPIYPKNYCDFEDDSLKDI